MQFIEQLIRRYAAVVFNIPISDIDALKHVSSPMYQHDNPVYN